MAKLVNLILLVALSLVVEGSYPRQIKEVVFYRQPVCSGHHYAISLGRGECKRVPDWLEAEGWNLSVDPKGHCIKVYENPNCLESIAPASAGYSYSTDSREDIIRRCRSIRELGFRTVRSFKMAHC